MINKLGFSGVNFVTPKYGTDLGVKIGAINFDPARCPDKNGILRVYKPATECQIGDVVTIDPNNPDSDEFLITQRYPDGDFSGVKVSNSNFKTITPKELEGMKIGSKLSIALGTPDDWKKGY
jgi:hypothetical protein